MDQQELRNQVKKRCMSQKEIASNVGCSHIHLNYWLKGKKELGPKTLANVQKFLEE